MSVSGNGFSFALSSLGSPPGLNAKASDVTSGTTDFFSSLSLKIAEFQSQTLGALMGSVFSTSSGKGSGQTEGTTDLSALFDAKNLTPDADSSFNGLSASGRNVALFDQESAYRMMTLINGKEVAYKAQFSELSEMKSFLTELQLGGESLGQISTTTDNASIKSQLQTFAAEYNEWTERFDADMQAGGILAGTKAAQVSRYELRQSVENRFNGASDGLQGLRDLGFTIDPSSKLAVLDTTKLDAVLASNKSGAVNTLQAFAGNFAKSAALLNAKDNFIPNRLSNLDRVIDYIDDNKAALQAEFGRGDPAKPAAQVAKALAAYRQHYGAASSAQA